MIGGWGCGWQGQMSQGYLDGHIVERPWQAAEKLGVDAKCAHWG
jgi:hypothetical protein